MGERIADVFDSCLADFLPPSYSQVLMQSLAAVVGHSPSLAMMLLIANGEGSRLQFLDLTLHGLVEMISQVALSAFFLATTCVTLGCSSSINTAFQNHGFQSIAGLVGTCYGLFGLAAPTHAVNYLKAHVSSQDSLEEFQRLLLVMIRQVGHGFRHKTALRT